MGIDASAVASVLGISTTYQDTRAGNVATLPQRVALFAQGQTGVTYSSVKTTPASAAAAGATYGWHSPIYLAMAQLKPINGDGIGSIPVDVYPLSDAGGAAAAVGDITPSGTATAAGAYYVRVSGVLGNGFVIPAGALATAANLTNACRGLGQSVSAVLGMPVVVSYTYGTVTVSAITGTGNGTVTALAVHSGATALPGDYLLVCNTAVTNGGIWTLTDPNGTVISTTLTITAGVGGTFVGSNVGGLDFTITDGTTDFGLNASFTITVPATKASYTAGWKGASGNAIVIEVIGPSLGVAFAITQPTGGLINPDVTAALAQVGNVWETMALNCMNISDTTTLDLFQTFGEGRWGAITRKPLVVFTGNTATTVGNATVQCSARPTDRVNCQLIAPGSPNLPFIVAARQLARIVTVANDNPPTDYCAQSATGLIPGTDGTQWDWATRDQAEKLGSSTIEVNDGVVQISDVKTFYHPTGESPPAYADVVDIVKLQNIIYNIALIFSAKEWAAAPLIPDDQATVNPNARRPKDAKAQAAGMVDQLAGQAILSDPKTSKKSITANINSSNPKRLDILVPVKLSGNTKIKSVDLEFGFFFGG